MSFRTPDMPDPLAIIRGEHDSVLGLNTLDFGKIAFKLIMKEGKLSLDLLRAVLERYQVKYGHPGDRLAVILQNFHFPNLPLIYERATFKTNFQWLLVRGAKFSNIFWRNVGMTGGTVLLSTLQVLHDYTAGTWPQHVPPDVWAQLQHGAMSVVHFDDGTCDNALHADKCMCGRASGWVRDEDGGEAEILDISEQNKAAQSEKSARSEAVPGNATVDGGNKSDDDGTGTLEGAALHSLTLQGRKTPPQDQNTETPRLFSQSRVSPKFIERFLSSDFSPADIEPMDAEHMCRTCLAAVVVAAGAAKEAQLCVQASITSGNPGTTQVPSFSANMWGMLSLLLTQPASSLTNALFAAFLKHFPSSRRESVYQTKLGINDSVWVALLTSYIRSGGEITIAELKIMDSNTAWNFVRSLASEWLHKNMDLLNPPVSGNICSGSSVLWDPSGTGLCAVVKCGCPTSTAAVIDVLLRGAWGTSLSRKERQSFRQIAAGRVARWYLCKEMGLAWGSGTGTGAMSDKNNGNLAGGSKTLLMSCVTETQITFANNTLWNPKITSVLQVVQKIVKELCGVKKNARP